MRYVPVFRGPPQNAQSFDSMERLGIMDSITHPELWEALLSSILNTPQQKAFNIRTCRFEPLKTLEPLAFYEQEEPKKSLVKCMEWTLAEAIPKLRSSGLIR